MIWLVRVKFFADRDAAADETFRAVLIAGDVVFDLDVVV